MMYSVPDLCHVASTSSGRDLLVNSRRHRPCLHNCLINFMSRVSGNVPVLLLGFRFVLDLCGNLLYSAYMAGLLYENKFFKQL